MVTKSVTDEHEAFLAEVDACLDEMRPYVHSHGGELNLIDWAPEEGRLRLQMAGACHGCPMSMLTMKDLIRYSARYYQVRAELAAALALVGLLLTAVGLHGVMAYGVTLRTREIGIRMALGARRRKVVDLVVRQALMLAGAGSLLGIPLALVAGFAMRSMLFGVPAWHAWSFLAALVVIFATAVVASVLPARRAAGVDPATVLREE